MATLKRAPIFATGTHNKQEFDEGRIDGIVHAFDALGLGGRVPLKLGHNIEQPLTDGQPALGWVERIWREGSTLYADFKDMPAIVYNAIKDGLYKFISIELLRDVKADTRVIPYVLDGVALLGADIPAVGTLADLQSLALSTRRGAERLIFTRPLLEVHKVNELSELRAQLAAQNQQLVAMTLEQAVRDGRMAPAGREQFLRRHGDKATVQEAVEWIASSPRPQRYTRAASLPTGEGVQQHLAPDQMLVERTRQYMRDNEVRHLQLTGERLTFDRAVDMVAREVARTDPGLLRAWVDLPGVQD